MKKKSKILFALFGLMAMSGASASSKKLIPDFCCKGAHAVKVKTLVGKVQSDGILSSVRKIVQPERTRQEESVSEEKDKKTRSFGSEVLIGSYIAAGLIGTSVAIDFCTGVENNITNLCTRSKHDDL